MVEIPAQYHLYMCVIIVVCFTYIQPNIITLRALVQSGVKQSSLSVS